MTLFPRSMTGRLITWLLLSTSIVLAAAGVFLSNEVRGIAIGSVDRTLHSKLQMITGLLHEEHGRVELELSEIIAGEYVIPRSGHYYQVLSNGAVMAASPSLANDIFDFPPSGTASKNTFAGETVYTSTGPDDEPVRVLRYRYAAFGRQFDITLAESLADSLAMTAAFKRFLLFFIPSTIIVLCFAAWRSAKVSFRPLAAFSSTIEMITHKNLAERIEAGTAARELATLARSFNDMLDRLQQVFESQKRLVADASHELKTPIAVIRTQCDVALQRSRSPEEYVDALRTIQASSGDMTRLISDLLSLARLDAGLAAAQNFEVISLKECLLDAVRMTEPLAAEKGVIVSTALDETLYVMGSRTGLEEAFLNVVENAVKYNIKEGSVAVSATRSGRTAVITVIDTGMGIRKEDLTRIFERFYRADTVRSTDGTGLGLSIVKSLVEALGGEIHAASEPGKGSTFTITLPAVETH